MKHLKKAFCLLLAAVMLLALGVPVMAAGEIPVDAEHFPDAALRTYVTDYCDTNKDNKLSAAECAAVQCIDLFEMQITKVADMTGIEHFTNLHELIACNNQITTLDLSGMTKLGAARRVQLHRAAEPEARRLHCAHGARRLELRAHGARSHGLHRAENRRVLV